MSKMLKADGVNISFGPNSEADGELPFNFKRTTCIQYS